MAILVRDTFRMLPTFRASPLAMLSRRVATVLGAVFILLFVFVFASRGPLGATSFYLPPTNPHRPHPPPAQDAQAGVNATTPPPQYSVAHDPACALFPDISNIQIIVKTGATESFSRIPTHLLTVLRCVPDFLVFSDRAETVAGIPIIDSLDNVLEAAKADNEDFDLYRTQKACAIDQDHCTIIHDKAKAGWNLDKYKNIHMAEKTWKMRPDKDWYLYVDADTYVLWNTLTQWLRKLKPTEKHYLGSVALIGNYPFAHGGSGYVLSRAAMAELVDGHPGIANKYDVGMKKECCGDYIFAKAMKEDAGIPVTQVWPTINGEKPFTLPYGPSHWCHPIVTMHHLNSEEMSTFWEWETRRYSSPSEQNKPSPVLLKDIYHAFFEPRLQSRREHWDNLSDDQLFFNKTVKEYPGWQLSRMPPEDKKNEQEKIAHQSFEHCRRACESRSDCFQFQFYEGGICATSKAMKLGHPVKPDRPWKDEPVYTRVSGWDVDKIRKWAEDNDKCSGNMWPHVKAQ